MRPLTAPKNDTPPHNAFSTRLHACLHAPALWYWLGFFLLNAFLFLPFYLFKRQDAAFLPHPLSLHSLLIARENPDIFRLNLEISLLLLIFPLIRWLWTPAARKWYARAFFLVFLLALIDAIYESITITLYHTTPVIFNDYPFFIHGIGLLRDGLRLTWWQLTLLGLIIIAIPILLYRLIHHWLARLPVARLGRANRTTAMALMILLLGSAIMQRQAMAQPESVISSLGAKLQSNARASLAARQQIKVYNSIQPEEIYDYAASTRLIQRPNIALIFVESYGSVLYKRPHFIGDYSALMKEMQARLDDAGWAMATGLSASPTWGGGSWMAYTSAEFGLHIDSQPQFLAIKDRYSQQPYPSLGRYLQSQGYQHIRLSPIERKLGAKEEQANDALYGPDRWITFTDLDYQGPLYGWGPSPPDQFSLNKSREIIRAQNDAPLFLFYLTQNSHYPWVPLPLFQDDWRALDDIHWPSPVAIGEPISHRDNISNYREAIRYQWQTLSDYILATPTDENTIFILIGDHQPPRVSRKNDGYETPIHIIARDAGFVHRFQQYGFEPGLLVSDFAPDMKHEGLYSLIVRELVDAFGVSKAPTPYLPDGIHLNPTTP